MPDYRKLVVWTKAKDLAVSVYGTVNRNSVARDFGLRDQILRASVSIASNIAEGYARESGADRAHFLNIARGSCAELETQLTIASEAGLMPSAAVSELIARSEEVSRMLYALRARLRND